MKHLRWLALVVLAVVPKASWRVASVVTLLLACGARTALRGGDYRDLATLSEATAAASPRAVKALANAGRGRLRQGHADEAVPLLESAVATWPDYAGAWQLLADAKRREREALSRAGSAGEPL